MTRIREVTRGTPEGTVDAEIRMLRGDGPDRPILLVRDEAAEVFGLAERES
jgi:hypothetical protein